MIQEEQAFVGHEFIFNGGSARCQGCRVKGVCLNQRRGWRYRVVKLRDVAHQCFLNEGLVRVVEVEPSAPPTCIEYRNAIEGSTFAFQLFGCDIGVCDHHSLCHPLGIEHGTKVRILEVGPRIDCPGGQDLAKVKVAYASE